MAEWGLQQWLLADAVSWRWLLQVVLLSATLSLASVVLFHGDPRSRRGLGVVAVIALFLLPIILLVWQPRWQIGVHQLPALPNIVNVPMVLFQGWLLLVGIASVVFFRQVHRIRQRLAQQPLYRQPDSLQMVAELAQRLRIKTPTLRLGDNCCATSIGQPLIIVPASFTSWEPQVRRAVLAHELVHLARRDDRWLLGLQLVWRWYLFCPWLGVLYHHFVQAIEQSCDDCAAELVGGRPQYLAGLAKAALAEQSDRPASTSLTYMVQNGLLQRTQRLLQRSRFFEIQAGPLAAISSVGLTLVVLLTTFELVPAVQQVHAIPLTPMHMTPMHSRGLVLAETLDHLETQQPIVEVHNSSNAPQERFTPMTIYPGMALLDGLEGQVRVRYGVAADGSVVHAQVHSAQPEKLFNEAALRAVRQTVYEPDHATGLPGASTTFEKQFVFRLERSRRRTGGYR